VNNKSVIKCVLYFVFTFSILTSFSFYDQIPVFGTVSNNSSSMTNTSTTPPSTPSCVIAPSKMLNWWPGDGNANDIQGQSAGIVNGQVSFVNGKVDKAFNFTGSGFISTPLNTIDRNGDGTISIDAWIKIPNLPKSYEHILGISNMFRLGVDSFGQISALPTVNLTNGPITLSTPVIFPIGNSYHHVAFVYDSAVGRGYLYIDGTIAGQSAPVPSGTRIVSQGQGEFTIGDLYSGGQAFTGSVDEVEIFDTALSQSQINSILGADSAGKCKPVSNQAPNCDGAYTNVSSLWPPNHSMKRISINGIVDPDVNDNAYVNVTSIRQDEPTRASPGDPFPDGDGLGTGYAQIRAERLGLGDGRVYHIGFTALDGQGGFCNGNVLVSVPHDQTRHAIDSGPIVDSTKP
jgi:hypothetical protein